MDSKQTLDGLQLSQKMNLIVSHQLGQQFYDLYKETQPHLTNILGHPFTSKQNKPLPLAPDQKPFFRSTNKRNNFLFLALKFSLSLLTALIVCRGVVVITTAQLHSTKPEPRFCTGSNPACSVSDSRW